MFKKLTEIRNNVLISKRLKALVVVIAFLILALGVLSVRSISSINNKINEVNNVYLKSMIELSDLIENIYSILIESHIIDEKSLTENAIDNSLNIDLLNTYLSEFEYAIIDDAQKTLYDGFVLEFQNYISILKEVNSLELKGNYEQARQIKVEREIVSFKKLQANVKSMMTYNVDGIQKSGVVITNLKQKVLNRIYFVGVLSVILTFLVVSFLMSDIKKTLKLVTSNLLVLKKGEIPEQSLFETRNEIGEMSGLINSLTDNLASLNKFANDISKGNYATDYTLAGENDLLGKALVNLRNNLRVTKEEDERRKLEDERRNWTNKGHALFGEILRQRSRALGQLTDDIIKNLVYYLGANQGGLFLINESANISKIELISAFAYDRKKFFERSINIGDGLIGTVALERNTIYLKEIPEDYIEIESGLGDATPKSLLIVPLKFEDDILGIVEIASFKTLEKHEIRFVEEIAQSIASTLLTARINARTEHLLEESRKQSEVLAAQEIESRQNIEEMRAAQELAQRREADLSGILSAVDNTLMKGEYELDGTLISVNNRHLQTLGYQLKEIKGKNIEIFVPKEELEDFRKVWASVIAGNPRQLEVSRRTKTGELLWLINQYTPVTDVSGKISKVLYLAHDVTKYKKIEDQSSGQPSDLGKKEQEVNHKFEQLAVEQQEVKLKTIELNGILNAIGTEQVIIEFDLEGKLIAANKKFEELVHNKIENIKGKLLNELFTLDKTEADYKSIYQKVAAGESITEVNQYVDKNGDLFWLKEYYTAISDTNNIPYKIISVAINITQLKLTEQKNLQLQQQVEQVIKKTETGTIIADKGIGKIVKSFESIFPTAELDKELAFISVNQIFTDTFKYSIKELNEKPLSRIIGDESKEHIYEILDKLSLDVVEETESTIVSKNKESAIYDLKIIPQGNEIIEKVIVYFLRKENDTKTDNLSEKLKEKTDKIKELEAKIDKIKKESNQLNDQDFDSDTDKLYDQWLNKLKRDD